MIVCWRNANMGLAIYRWKVNAAAAAGGGPTPPVPGEAEPTGYIVYCGRMMNRRGG